jgi:S1-C subfamily serine protease
VKYFHCRPLEKIVIFSSEWYRPPNGQDRFLKLVRKLTATFLLVTLVLALGCSSSPSGKSGSRGALADLRRGVCPDEIIMGGDKGISQGRERYGSDTSYEDLAGYRSKELSNCQKKLNRGDARALSSLVDYYSSHKKAVRVVAAYETYLKTGKDPQVLGSVSADLYRMYATGDRGVAADEDKAFHYAGQANKYQAPGFELIYANELFRRGLFKDAIVRYRAMADEVDKKLARREYRNDQICEANLRLGDMYFRGLGTRENWYLGYYFWHQGLSLAESPEWGSCAEDNFVYNVRYSYESERKKAAQSRVDLLSRSEISQLEDAVQVGGRLGLDYVSSMRFTQRAAPPTVAYAKPARGYSPNSPVKSASTGSGSWRPFEGGICKLRSSNRSLPWSEVFRRNSGAIWTLSSGMDNGKKSLGSAVAVSPTRLITNCHLIHNAQDIRLRQGNRTIRGSLVSADRAGDRCIVKSSASMPSYVSAARQYASLMVGEDVSAIGNPKGLDASLSRGIVAQKRLKDGHAYVQTDTAISTGSSGGGLFDTAGNLVGITTFTIAEGENLNFAIAIDEFCKP